MTLVVSVIALAEPPMAVEPFADGGLRPFGITEDASLAGPRQERAQVFSRIIFQPDYSDTFTEGAAGDRFRPAPFGVANPTFGLPVERRYENREVLWSPDWVFVNDWTVSPTEMSPYPGGSGRDSDTGFAEVEHEGTIAFGLRYSVRSDFVVQFQAVQASNWIAVAVGDAGSRGNFSHPSALTVRFYADGKITVGTAKAGEIDTGIRSGITGAWAWHNYGVRFDLDHKRLEFYVDERYLGSIRLANLEGNPFAGTAYSYEAVSVGASGGDRFWLDDFQIGAPFDLSIGPRFTMFSLIPDLYGGAVGLSPQSLALMEDGGGEPPPIDPPVIPAPAALPAGLVLLALYALRGKRKRRRSSDVGRETERCR